MSIRGRYQTDFQYSDRASKAKYVWLKYRSILEGKILDVGADECYLKQYLDEEASYWGIGLGGNPDQQIDLEQQGVPFDDDSFDVVLCLDVLEHIENIHHVFDELCRVSARYVIISLPNPWGILYDVFRRNNYKPDQATKYYGLPLEKPVDRHKWFFSAEEAEKFILYRAGKNQFRVMQIDYDRVRSEGNGVRGFLRRIARVILFRNKQLDPFNLYAGTLWAILEKEQ